MGKQFVDSLPPVKSGSFPNASFRRRTFKEIPALQQVGLFAQENFTAQLGNHEINLEAGLRYDLFSENKSALSPRINANIEVIPNVLRIRGGYGLLAKAPSLLYLHPENVYFEYINVNELASNIPQDQQVFMTTTRVFNTQNPDLKISKNEKAEVGFDLEIAKSQLRVTAFQEQVKDGYSYSLINSSFQPVNYIEYKRVNAASPVFVGTDNAVLAKFNKPNNTARLEKKGIEFELNLKRIDAIRTQFSINGMHLWRKSYSSAYTYYDAESGLGANRTHVGLYDSDMIVSIEKATSTAIRATHNIPSIGLVVTLTAETIWNESDWKLYGNDSIPVKYISKLMGRCMISIRIERRG